VIYTREAFLSWLKIYLSCKILFLLLSVSSKTYALMVLLQKFKGLSFPTISSVGPNAAVIHYSPDLKTCSELDADSIYLFDSGAQVFSILKFSIIIFFHLCLEFIFLPTPCLCSQFYFHFEVSRWNN